MNEPVTVTYSLEEMFARFEQKIDSNQKETNEKFKELNKKLETIQKDVTDLKLGQAKLTEKVEGMDNRLKTVEGTQKSQVWALIAPAVLLSPQELDYFSQPTHKVPKWWPPCHQKTLKLIYQKYGSSVVWDNRP